MWGRFAAAVAVLSAGILLSVVVGAGRAADGVSTAATTTAAPTTESTSETASTVATTTTTATTTTAPATTPTTAKRTATPRTVPRTRALGAATWPLRGACAAAVVELLLPGRKPLVLVPRPARGRTFGGLAYPGDGAAVTVRSLVVA